MKIAILSKSDALGGGASRIATELVDQLLDSGYHADHWAARQYAPAHHTIHRLHGDRSLVNIIIRIAHTIFRKVGAPEYWPIERINTGLLQLMDYDILHAHDISNALAVQTLAWLAQKRPLIWTLHDCSPFTGGCLSPLDCKRFRDHCNHCPQQGIWPLQGLFDLTGPILSHKRRFAISSRFTPLAPSRWMSDMASSSGFFPRPQIVSNGIDLNVFQPIAKEQARRRLDLPVNRRVIAICSSNLHDTQKGVRNALQVAQVAKELNPLVLMIGRNISTLRQKFPDLEIVNSGFLMNRKKLATWYSAADLMLYCSLADNQPLTVMESMSCGTPVVGYATGGIPELVTKNVNGWLVSTGDHVALAKRITDILKDRERLHRWSEAAAFKAKLEFGWERCLASHISLYRSLLTDSFDTCQKS